MRDQTGGVAIGRVSVVGLPADGWICAGVIKDDGSNPIWALQVGKQERSILRDGFGDGFDLADLKDLVADLGGGLCSIVDELGGNPQTHEKQGEKDDSTQNGDNGTGEGAAKAGQFHVPIVAGWYPNARTA